MATMVAYNYEATICNHAKCCDAIGARIRATNAKDYNGDTVHMYISFVSPNGKAVRMSTYIGLIIVS
jgi:hypothetical protein